MANTIAGMFSSPEDIRNARVSEIQAAQERARMSQGGRISDLNAMVAGSGYSTGRMLGEQLGGMLGMSSPEEQKAAELQAMAENMDLTTSTGLADFAKMLNGLGYTKEAIQIMEKRDSVLDRERRLEEEDTTKAMREGKLRKGLPRIELRPRTDSKGNVIINPATGQPMYERVEVPTYERWSEEAQAFVPVKNTAASDLLEQRLAEQKKFVDSLTGNSSNEAEATSGSGQMKRAGRKYSLTTEEEETTSGPRPRTRQ